MKLDLLVVGDVFIDVLVKLPRKYERKSLFTEINIRHGGRGNVAVWASRAGLKIGFIGKCGVDCFGEEYEKELKRERVITRIYRGSRPTGLCVSLIHENGERTLLADRGANDEITSREIIEASDLFAAAKFVYFSAYSFHNAEMEEVFTKALKIVKEQGKVVCFDGASATILEERRESFPNIIKSYVDILILNEEEGKALTNIKQPIKICEELQGMVRETVVTLGERGCIVGGEGKTFHIEAEKVRSIIDTTGAGDAFTATYISRRVKGKNMIESAKKACKIAAAVVQRVGAR